MKISNLGRKSLVQRQDSHTQEDGVNIKVIRMEATGESDSLVASSGNMSSTNIIVDPQASEIVTIPDRAGMHHSLEAPSSNILPANIIVEPKSFEVVTMPGRAGMSAYEIWLDEGNEGTKEAFLNGLAESALRYKGKADTFADLPATGNAVGDFWNIRDTGFHFLWDGLEWDQISGLTDLDNKVDKVAGKGLSTNDYTDEDKAKVDGIEIGALIKNISFEGNDLVLTHENGTTTRTPLNELLTGVVKKINDRAPDSSGAISLSYEDLKDLPKLYDEDEIEDIVDNKVSEVDIMIGSVSVYTEEGPFAGFRNIDGHTLQESDTILVVGNGSNNGIYIVNKSGVWQRIQKVEKFQVVSIDNGIVYGGSMQKKMEDGITKMVKKPERSAWRVLI